MKKLKFYLATAALLLSSVCANAGSYTVEDFESYSIGTKFNIVDRSSGSVVSSDETYAEVAADPADENNKVLHVYMKSWGKGVEINLIDQLKGKKLTDKFQTLKFRFRRVSSNNYVQFHAYLGSESLYGDSDYPGQGNQNTWVDKSYSLRDASDSNESTSFRFGLHSNESEYYIDDVVFEGTGTLDVAPSITTDLNAEYTAQQGQALNLSVVVAGSPAPTYQWYTNNTASTEGATACAGATTNTYAVPTSVVGDAYYYCVATNTLGNVQSAIAKVTITAPIAVTGITLDQSALSINRGQNVTLTPTILPVDAANQNVTWTTSNSDVATVNNGVVTGVAEGEATITATTEDGGFQATCTVTVNPSSSKNGQYILDGLFLMAQDFEDYAVGDALTVENTSGGTATIVADPNGTSGNAAQLLIGQYKSSEYLCIDVTLPAGSKLSDFASIAFDYCVDKSKGSEANYKEIKVALDNTSTSLGSINTGTAPTTWTTKIFSLSDKATDNNTFKLYIGGINGNVAAYLFDNIRLLVDGSYTQITTSNTWWKYDSTTGDLTIKGEGEIPAFNSSSNIPWNSYRQSGIKNVSISEGITSIGKNGFYECNAITSVSFPSTLTFIGEQAFINNTALTAIDLSNTKVTEIVKNAFKGCNVVTSIELPATLATVGDAAFYIKNANNVINFRSNPTLGSGVFYANNYKSINLLLTDSEKPFVSATSSNTYNSVKYTRTFTNDYATMVIPFVPESTDGISVYKLSAADANTVTFEEETEFAANAPYLVKAASAGEVVLSAGATTIAAPVAGTKTVGSWDMVGTYTTVVKEAGDNAYGFYNGALYRNTGNMKVNPLRAYMTTTSSSAKAVMGIAFEDDVVTGINAVSNDESFTGEIYNINGVRQTSLQKGINIVKMANGETKKIIIK